MKILNLTNKEASDIKFEVSSFPDGQQNVTIQDVIDIFKQAREEKTIKGHYCDNIRRVVLRTHCATWSMLTKQEVLLDYNLKEVTYADFME